MYNMSAVAVNGTNHTLVAAQNSTGWIKLVEETATGWTVTPLASNGDNDSISLAVTRQANGQSQPWIVYTDKQDDLWVVNDTGNERQIVTGFVDEPSIATNNGTQLFVTYENTSSNDIQLVKEEGCGWFGPITLQSGTYSNPSTKFEFYNNYNASTILDYIFYEPGNKKVLYSNRTLDQSCTIETQNQFIFVGNVPERGSGVERLSPESITLA
ncbi:MAG: hypothetical protein SVU32_07295, partial [Candidatus Nanohaloarchaea archaeon]|nr:hypothetical protein [Candidatus Nanohaloarchaea archaeon]